MNGISHSVSVDNVIFGYDNGGLEVLLVKHGSGLAKGKWALPGYWLGESETLEEAAVRVLRDSTGVSDIYLEQLHTFSSLDRFPGKRVITTAFYSLIRPVDYKLTVGLSELEVDWFDVNRLPKLVFDHSTILEEGVKHLRHKVRHAPIGFNLLPIKFTLLELQKLYEAVLAVELDKPNFRRKMLKMHFLIPCNEKQTGVAHRGAALYRFDKKHYKRLLTQGFVFDI